MAFCTSCGAKVEDGVQFCPICGSQISQATNQQAQTANANMYGNAQQGFNQQASNGSAAQDSINKALEGINNTADYTSQFDPADIASNKVMAILAYIGILVLIPILAAPSSKYARFHANQGLTLLITDVAFAILRGLVVGIFSNILGVLGIIFNVLFGIASLAILALLVIGIVNAASGKAKELPFIGSVHLLK